MTNQLQAISFSWRDWLQKSTNLDEIDLSAFMTWLYTPQDDASCTDDDLVTHCFHADFFQHSPQHYQTARIHVGKSYHHYGNEFRAEMLSMSASRPLCAVLAMLALQAVLTAKRIELSLNHPQSGIQKIYFELQEHQYPLEMKAIAWHYETEALADYIQHLRQQQQKFNFCLSGEDFARQGHWLEDRDHMYCVGTAQELTAWAGVLLNMAHPDNLKDELGFECDVGFGGVHAGSAEFYVYLPSSLGYALDDSEYATTSYSFD